MIVPLAKSTAPAPPPPPDPIYLEMAAAMMKKETPTTFEKSWQSFPTSPNIEDRRGWIDEPVEGYKVHEASPMKPLEKNPTWKMPNGQAPNR